MSESIRISVVTPSYNQGVFLGRTLASVASQSYPPHEHLVFDGGSSDETLQVLKAAGPGVRWVSQPDNGQADAVNQGLQAARGNIIGWLNSDDIYYPDAFKTVTHMHQFYSVYVVDYRFPRHLFCSRIDFCKTIYNSICSVTKTITY